jgi:hypothetical protein
MLDATDVIPRCLDSRIAPQSFYDPKHAILFRTITDLHAAGQPVDLSIVAQELARTQQLDAVGGYAFLTKVTARIPTTASAGYHMAQVVELSTQRQLISLTQRANEQAYNQPSSEVLETIEAQLLSIRSHKSARKLTSFMDYQLPVEENENDLIGTSRYLGRGDSCLIVSSSGMGKSSLSLLWAIHLALGRDYLGIKTKRPSKSLIIQSEDSDGDIGEIVFSAKTTMKLTPQEIEAVGRNVIIVRDKISRGPAFISALRGHVAKHKPDFVWLNPLHAFAGCEITDATQIGQFLREGLNKANSDDSFCYMIVHHTPKPISGKNVADKKWHEFMYDAAGSAELVNWTRAVITLRPTDVEGQFTLVLAKRGKRAGVVQKVQGAVTTFLQPTLKIPIQQSQETIMIPGRKRPFHLIEWTVGPTDLVEGKESKSKYANSTTKTEDYTDGEVLTCFPSSDTTGEMITKIQKRVAGEVGMKRAAFMVRRNRLIEDGFINRTPDGGYRRTALGDMEAKKFLQKVA